MMKKIFFAGLPHTKAIRGSSGVHWRSNWRHLSSPRAILLRGRSEEILVCDWSTAILLGVLVQRVAPGLHNLRPLLLILGRRSHLHRRRQQLCRRPFRWQFRRWRWRRWRWRRGWGDEASIVSASVFGLSIVGAPIFVAPFVCPLFVGASNAGALFVGAPNADDASVKERPVLWLWLQRPLWLVRKVAGSSMAWWWAWLLIENSSSNLIS